MNKNYPFELQDLKFNYDELMPCISCNTLKFHHDKHFLGYINNLNGALEEYKELHNLSLVEILSDLDNIPESIRTSVINNGGGVFNHSFYFESLCAPNSKTIPEVLKNKIEERFSSVEHFKEEFKKIAMAQFGSGWAWLVKNSEGDLKIISTSNQNTPLKDGYIPLLTIDVWEHAYYLDYQNLRAKYIDEYFKIIDWDVIASRL